MNTRLENKNGGNIFQEDVNSLLGLQIDALALLGNANYDLSLGRREVIETIWVPLFIADTSDLIVTWR